MRPHVSIFKTSIECTVKKMSLFGVFMVHIFPHSNLIRTLTEQISEFGPNTGKYVPEKL